MKINIQGIERSGETFGNISEFTASGDAVAGENHFVPAEKTGECYWARRGPSVHMMYEMPDEDIEFFYNEVVVPKGNDIHGTYFMTTGFGEGYMGIQSIKDDKGNNANMVLFSVWSPYSTDNPDAIPDSLHVKVLSKGDGVTAQNFGNEGSGKQSFMHYPWKAGKTYRTLVKVQPDNNGNTIYTGYFGDEYGKWHLLSRMLRPATDTYYTRSPLLSRVLRPGNKHFHKKGYIQKPVDTRQTGQLAQNRKRHVHMRRHRPVRLAHRQERRSMRQRFHATELRFLQREHRIRQPFHNRNIR